MALFKKGLSKKERLNKTDKKGYSFGPIDALNLYTRLIADKWTKGRNDNPKEVLDNGGILGDKDFFYSVNRVFTNKGIKKPYFLQLPEYIDRGFITDLRNEIDDVVIGFNQSHEMNENVSVTSISDGKNFKVDLSQGRMQGRFKLWAKQYEKVSAEMQDQTLEDVLKTDKHTQDTRHKVGSYLYMKEAVEKEKASFYRTNIIVELVATSDDILDEADRTLREFVFKKELEAKEVFIQTNQYMKSYTPMASNKDRTLISQMNPRNVFADETLSSLTVPTHGVIGDAKGQYYGIDILSRRYVTIDMYSGTDANNIFLTARSGEGKSQYAKMLYTFYQLDPRFSTVVFDYEGTEYLPLARIIGANVISLSASSGRFVNTMVIGRPTGDPEIDGELKSAAQETTVKVFDLLVHEEDGMTSEQTSILSSAIKEVYVDFGVTEEMDSWINSEGITFFHIYQKIKDFLNESRYQIMREEFDVDNLKNFILNLKPYFEEGEVYKHWFKNPISVQDIIDDNHVVFSFGMGNSTEAMENSKSVALRQLFASHITTLLANHNKKQGRKTVVFLEELQRYLKQRYSGDIIAKFASGGRKNGLVTYLITNSPSELLQLKESDNDEIRKNASTIMSNITMFLIGALFKTDMENLIQEYSLENSRGILDQLTNIAEGNGSEGLKYSFYIRYKGQSGVLRMLSHPELEGIPLYETDPNKEDDGLRTVEDIGKKAVEEGIMDADEEDKKQKGGDFEDYKESSKKTRNVWQKVKSDKKEG